MSQEKLDIYHRDIAPLLYQAANLAKDAKINLAAFAGFPEPAMPGFHFCPSPTR